jgi:hypothetical protein
MLGEIVILNAGHGTASECQRAAIIAHDILDHGRRTHRARALGDEIVLGAAEQIEIGRARPEFGPCSCASLIQS